MSDLTESAKLRSQLDAARVVGATLRELALSLLDGLQGGHKDALYAKARDMLHDTADAATWLAERDAKMTSRLEYQLDESAACVERLTNLLGKARIRLACNRRNRRNTIITAGTVCPCSNCGLAKSVDVALATADAGAWLESKLSEARDAAKSEVLAQLEEYFKDGVGERHIAHVFTAAQMAEHDAKVRGESAARVGDGGGA